MASIESTASSNSSKQRDGIEQKHVDTFKSDDKTAEDELKNFDAEFGKVDQGTLFDLILWLPYTGCASKIV